MTETRTYTRQYECDNCGDAGDLTLKFGQRAPESCICPTCGIEGAKVLPVVKKNKVVTLPTVWPPKGYEPHITISTPPQPTILPPVTHPDGTILCENPYGINSVDTFFASCG